MKTIPLTQFHGDFVIAAADDSRRGFVRNALAGYMTSRGKTKSLFADYPAVQDAG